VKSFLLSDFLRLLTLFLVALFVLVLLVWAARADTANGPEQNSTIYSDGRTGRVGIGTAEPLATLDVSEGEIKLGSTGVACGAGLAGTLRYAEKRLQFCDGAGWRNVSLDKAK
jgi:hypothetical protein